MAIKGPDCASSYEALREQNVIKNREKLKQLGLFDIEPVPDEEMVENKAPASGGSMHMPALNPNTRRNIRQYDHTFQHLFIQEREKHIDELTWYCQDPKIMPLLVINGYTASGKTATLQYVLREKIPHIQYVYIYCVEIVTAKHLFEEILSQLENSPRPCSQFLDFIARLAGVLKATNTVLILDGVEKFIEGGMMDLLSSILRLNDQMAFPLSIGIVLITPGLSLSLEQLICHYAPIYIHFPLFSNEFMLKIIQEMTLSQTQMNEVAFQKSSTTKRIRKSDHDRLCRQWVANIFQVLRRECSIWTEILHSILLLLPVFENYVYQPQSQAIVASQEHQLRLLTQSQPYIGVMSKNLLHHNLSFPKIKAEVEKVGPQHTGSFDVSTKRKAGDVESDKKRPDMTLAIKFPPETMCLIVACYLASFNSTDSDANAFLSSNQTMQRTSKRQRKHGTKKESSKVTIKQQLLGPKVFPLQRLLAIYYAILENVPDIDKSKSQGDSIFLKLTQLIQMQLLTRTSALSELDNIMYRCHADLEFVSQAAGSIGMDLTEYI